MEYIHYNVDLAKRFVSDYNLPIPIISEMTFGYYLGLYEKEYGALTKWNKLIKMIEEKYDNSVGKFLDEYYNIRENIIQSTLNNPAYERFNQMDMNVFSIKERPNISSNNIYNENNVGEIFLSIDLKKANFQTLKMIDKDIVLGEETYEDFIGRFTDLDYVKESKYSRQVIFGKLNPKRHITAEKYFITKIYKSVVEALPYLNGKCVSLTNDEMVFKLDSHWELPGYNIKELLDTDNIEGFDVHIEVFKLKGFHLKFKKSGKVRTNFFVKDYLDNKEHKFRLISAPLPYHCIIYKLYCGEILLDIDYHFDYEGIEAKFCEEFIVEEI